MNIQSLNDKKPQATYLADYAIPPYDIETVDLTFTLNPEDTKVRARLKVYRTIGIAANTPLELNGEELKLISIAINGRPLTTAEYTLSDKSLIIPSPPASFTLDTEVEISPNSNQALEGLYCSNNIYCTQCEPEGFRRITFFIDRPDVMAIYRTKIIAPKTEFPILLSNGNPSSNGELENGLHFATWHDPFPKPSYLFALVAGNLAHIAGKFRTMSGRDIQLRIYVEKGNESRAQYAMEALKRAMRWDERAFSREYDLDVFNIVAVRDFNMGAMENKGLNIFNDSVLLADPETATDMDYYLIESIIAHEYFHNWSGNRVTCRDWFQLSLKEGLTVFRDQEFTADVRSRANKRIDDVNLLRASQFREDAGPFAHPIRPDRYIEINNFYTATVYQKGAEVIRMMQTIVGKDTFRRGIELYFSRYDGKAATCDDFIASMEETAEIDLSQFKLWYSQAGTPHIKAEGTIDSIANTYKLTVHQSCEPTPGQPIKKPFHIPLAVGLLDEMGKEITLELIGVKTEKETKTVILDLRDSVHEFFFENVKSKNPRLSINRNFSAPVTLSVNQTPSDQAFIVAHDSDLFNRWAVNQEYSTNVILDVLSQIFTGQSLNIDSKFLNTIGTVIKDVRLNNAFKASLLGLPTESYISTRMEQEDPLNLYAARKFTRKSIAIHHCPLFQDLYEGLGRSPPYAPDADGMGIRMLKRVALGYMAAQEKCETTELVKTLFDNADNMTERMDALYILNSSDTSQRSEALLELYNRFKNQHLVVNKWFSVQASAPLPGTLKTVKSLLNHPAFDLKSPNKVRAVIGTFANLNPLNFHALDGSGYSFLADQILEIDSFNPLVAARLVAPFGRWRRFATARQAQIKEQLERIAASPKLSADVYEMARKSLDD
ncbi:MAG: aminopeptidase N [Candidatus Marinimicrobia bacterium]|nr:aminopeptidase N [Candidatus Neomarinimicrobiota bacterium]